MIFFHRPLSQDALVSVYSDSHVYSFSSIILIGQLSTVPLPTGATFYADSNPLDALTFPFYCTGTGTKNTVLAYSTLGGSCAGLVQPSEIAAAKCQGNQLTSGRLCPCVSPVQLKI